MKMCQNSERCLARETENGGMGDTREMGGSDMASFIFM